MLEQVIRPNGVTTTYDYDTAGRRPTDITHQNGAAELLAQYSYEYDNGTRKSEFWIETPDPEVPGTTITRKEKYEYDDRDQVTQVIYSDDATFDANDKTVEYTYDGNGNRLTMTVTENGEVTEMVRYFYGHENRLMESVEAYSGGTTHYYYDPAGNRVMKVTDGETTQYEYDERNLLTKVVSATEDVEFEYDGNGNRIAKTVNGERTEYLVEPISPIPQVLEEFDATGTRTASYTYGMGRISGKLPGDATQSYFLADGLGNNTIADR